MKVSLCNAQSEIFHHISAMFVSSSCVENCVALKAAPPQGTRLQLVAAPTCTWKLDMNFDDTAFVHMLKDYSVFSFVPKLTFRNETKG